MSTVEPSQPMGSATAGEPPSGGPADGVPGESGTSESGTAEGAPRGGPTVLRMLLGIQLRRLREAARITPERAGYEIRASRSKISRLEHGRVTSKVRDVHDLLTLYGVTDDSVREELLSLAREANES